MRGKTKERWQELCEQAAVEQDSKKLNELVKEIIRLLEEKAAKSAEKVAATRATKQSKFRGYLHSKTRDLSREYMLDWSPPAYKSYF
jgi:hypothetical protein